MFLFQNPPLQYLKKFCVVFVHLQLPTMSQNISFVKSVILLVRSDDNYSISVNSTSDEPFLEVDPIAITGDKPPFTRKEFNPCPPSTLSNTSSFSTSNCLHNQQFIIQKPFPLLYLPSLPLYHRKTMAGELYWGSTCWYCMHIEYDKYGCDSKYLDQVLWRVAWLS